MWNQVVTFRLTELWLLGHLACLFWIYIAEFSCRNRNARKYTYANLIVKYSQLINENISHDQEVPISLSCNFTIGSCKIIEKFLMILGRLCSVLSRCVSQQLIIQRVLAHLAFKKAVKTCASSTTSLCQAVLRSY